MPCCARLHSYPPFLHGLEERPSLLLRFLCPSSTAPRHPRVPSWRGAFRTRADRAVWPSLWHLGGTLADQLCQGLWRSGGLLRTLEQSSAWLEGWVVAEGSSPSEHVVRAEQ